MRKGVAPDGVLEAYAASAKKFPAGLRSRGAEIYGFAHRARMGQAFHSMMRLSLRMDVTTII
jgi:hypothetical protein